MGYDYFGAPMVSMTLMQQQNRIIILNNNFVGLSALTFLLHNIRGM